MRIPRTWALTFLALTLTACRSTSNAMALSEGAMEVTRDIPYASEPPAPQRLTSLDIYRPANGRNLPVMIFIHGGSWRWGDKKYVAGKPAFFTSHGYVFASVNYRLSPEVVHPAHVEDVAKGIAWLHQHVAEYGGDPNRMYVMGHSSGAQLAALVATDERYLKDAGADLRVIKGVIVLDGGGYDIPKMVASGEAFAKSRYRRAFGDDTGVWKDASAVNHVAPGKGIPPFLIVHAWKRNASREEALELAKALKGAGVRAEVFHEPNRNHVTLNSCIGEDGDETTGVIMKFLDSLGRGGQPGA